MFRKVVNYFKKDVDYKTEFMSAVKRTRKWGIETPCVNLTEASLLTGDKKDVALSVIQRAALNHTAEEVSQQCFYYMFSVQSALEEALQSPLYYTLGYIHFNQTPVFYTSEKELRDKMQIPLSGAGAINLHAWLTTPNLEIIDLTFGTTYGIVNNTPSTIGRYAFQHYSTFNENMIYHPQLVGDGYLRKTGALIDSNSFGMFVL